MERYERDKHLVPRGHLYEVSYKEFISDPVHCMETIYDELRLGDFSFCRTEMCNLAEQEKDHHVTRHELSIQEKALIERRMNSITLAEENQGR